MDVQNKKILLLGNGLLQAFGGESWNEFLKSISNDSRKSEFLNCPEPLKAILLTNDRVDVAMKKKCADIMARDPINEELVKVLRKILSIGFDHILTTNYTYELEEAAIYPEKITVNKLRKMAASTVGRVESKYLLHTYNKVSVNGVDSKIWHVHGEARKPDSTILGHYYYGNSLFEIKKTANMIRRVDRDTDNEKSWVEAFLFGDVYCLGFGYGLCEFDLWWLLNRKARERNNKGKLYFYEPSDKNQREKLELLKLMRTPHNERLVETYDLNFVNGSSIIWAEFYKKALCDIEERSIK